MQIILEILPYIFPIISLIIGFFLGKISDHSTAKKEALIERYEKLYVPFLRLTVESWRYVKSADSFSEELLKDFIDLFSNNVNLMGTESLNNFSQMYEAYLFFQYEKLGSQHFEGASIKFAYEFDKFCNILMKECTILQRKLNYSEISPRFSDAYSSTPRE